MPRLTLADVLRRRRQTLKKFVDDSGVQSYEGLCNLCHRLGMLPPDEGTYKREVNPPLVSSQLDGIVVLDPPPVVDEMTGRRIDPDAPVHLPEVKVVVDKNDSAMETLVADDDEEDDDSGDADVTESDSQPKRRRRRKKKEDTKKDDGKPEGKPDSD